MKLAERFDRRAAAALLRTQSDKEPELAAYVASATPSGSGTPDFGAGGGTSTVEVEYTTRGLGRFVAKRVADGGHYSYTSMWGESRAKLAPSSYLDVDMENSHPRLAVQVFKFHGIPHALLREYVDHREARLAEVATCCGVDRAAAKKLFLSLCFGGTARVWAQEHAVPPPKLPAFVEGLQDEMRAGMAALVADHVDGPRAKAQQQARKPGKRDPLASQFAYLMQDAERRCLEAIVEGARASGREVGALIHDGLLITRSPGADGAADDAELMPALLRAWERRVKRVTGFEVVLAVKPWLSVPPPEDEVEEVACAPTAPSGPSGSEGPGLALMARPSPSPLVEYPPSTTYSLSDADAASVKEVLGVSHGCKEWLCETKENGLSKLHAVGCRQCLADPSKRHSSWSDSFLLFGAGNTTMALCCVGDDKRKLRAADHKRIQAVFGALFPAPKKDPEELCAHERLVAKVEAYASQRSLRKAARTVYRPVPGCPCAYEVFLKFKPFVQLVLRGDPDYRKSVRRATEIEAYLDTYDEEPFPDLVRDRDLLSFANGVVELSTGRFVPYGTVGAAHPGGEYPDAALEFEGRVARHHIPLPWTGDTATPLLDKVFATQYPDEGDGRPETLCALIGRLLFKVNQLDKWQVMPLLIGEGGTGKSLILSVVCAMLDAGAISEVDNSQEKTFGLQDKHDKELIVVRDAPANMSAVLPQEHFQKMVTGEGIQISVKNDYAFSCVWSTPMIAASNVMFDYKDNASQVTRRVTVFRFPTVVSEAAGDASLEERILGGELPNVVARCLDAYRRLRADGNDRKIFWSICPATLKEARDDARAEGNLVHKFLTAGPDDSSSKWKRVYVRQVKGMVTDWTVFKRAFDAYIRYKHPGSTWRLNTEERGPFTLLGYTVAHENLCKACGMQGHQGCCDAYSKANRVKRWRIHDMELVREDIIDRVPSDDGVDDLE